MMLKNLLIALFLSATVTMGLCGMAKAASVFTAQDTTASLKAKATERFVGRTISQIRQTLDRDGYQDAMIIEMNQSIDPGKSMDVDGVTLTSNDIHLMIKTKKSQVFDVGSPRISFFLRMKDGLCAEVLKARKFAK